MDFDAFPSNLSKETLMYSKSPIQQFPPPFVLINHKDSVNPAVASHWQQLARRRRLSRQLRELDDSTGDGGRGLRRTLPSEQ